MEANHMLLQQAHQQGFGWSRALPIRIKSAWGSSYWACKLYKYYQVLYVQM